MFRQRSSSCIAASSTWPCHLLKPLGQEEPSSSSNSLRTRDIDALPNKSLGPKSVPPCRGAQISKGLIDAIGFGARCPPGAAATFAFSTAGNANVRFGENERGPTCPLTGRNGPIALIRCPKHDACLFHPRQRGALGQLHEGHSRNFPTKHQPFQHFSAFLSARMDCRLLDCRHRAFAHR